MKNPKERSYLNEISDGTSNISFVSTALKGLSTSFYRVGNDKVAEELLEYAEILLEAKNLINKGIGSNLNDQLKESQEFTGKLLCFAMGGDPSKLYKDDKEA